MTDIHAIGIDEVFWRMHYKLLTTVYEITAGRVRLLCVRRKRTYKTTLRISRWFGKKRSAKLRWLCSDMWRPYLAVIAKKAPQATPILDRFHIAAKMSEAIDDVRAQEARDIRAKGLAPVLKSSRWTLSKCTANRTKSKS